jgi:phage recombination protein Bet
MSLEPMGTQSKPRDPMFSQAMLEDSDVADAVEIRPTPNLVQMWTDDQIALIKRTIAKGATDDEFAMFLHYCKTSGLDPLRKQAHFQVRVDKQGERNVIMMAGIDGMRARAESMPDFLGVSSGAVYEQDHLEIDLGQGIVKHTITFPRQGKIIGAWARVCRKNRTPYVHWLAAAEYKGSYMARQMPGLMLEKTAEAQALRHEYPEGFSGAYSYEEFGETQDSMDNADSVVVDDGADRAVEPKQKQLPESDQPTDAQRERFSELMDRAVERGELSVEVAEQALTWAESATKKAIGAKIGHWKAREAELEQQESEDSETTDAEYSEEEVAEMEKYEAEVDESDF